MNIVDLLPTLVDVQASNALVEKQLDQVLTSYKAGNAKPLVQFFGAYTSWNGYFAAGVTGLTAKITNQRSMFMDPDVKIAAVADRGSHIASYVFDAAREEYHDTKSSGRPSHRALAQAFLVALTAACLPEQEDSSLNILLNEPTWLVEMNRNTPKHYLGNIKDDHNKFNVFTGMGYHIGSEWLADREFTIIDQMMAQQVSELRTRLQKTQVRFMDRAHPGYAWITAHSGEGDAVEQDHYDKAIIAAELAFKYIPDHERDEALEYLKLGVKQFAMAHADFFSKVVDGRTL